MAKPYPRCDDADTNVSRIAQHISYSRAKKGKHIKTSCQKTVKPKNANLTNLHCLTENFHWQKEIKSYKLAKMSAIFSIQFFTKCYKLTNLN